MLEGFKIRTLLAMLVMAGLLAGLASLWGPDSILNLLALALGGVLVSLTNPAWFGWTDEK